MDDERSTFYLYYYENENLFTNERGQIVFNMFELITPNDMFLFRKDDNFNCFPMRNNRDAFIQIIPIPFEFWAWQEVAYLDIGDDLERVKRYEEARLYGY